MASSNKNVTVLTPNGRRQNIKVSPNTTILEILEEVCIKQGFKPDEYDLKHHNNILDVSSIMRFSGLPNNAQLEMCPIKKPRAESSVILGLQLENGTRLTGNFAPEENLFNILTQLCPNEIKIEENPVIIYMRQEVYGLDILKATTLRKLGLTSGRAMLRLIHRQPEELHTQANISTPLPSKPVQEKPFVRKLYKSEPENKMELKIEAEQNRRHSSSTKENINYVTDFIKKEKSKKTNDPQKIKSTKIIPEVTHEQNSKVQNEPDLVFLGERNALAFSLDMAQTIPHDLPDEFFDLTVNDAKRLLRDLKQRRKELEETPLQTTTHRNLEQNKKMLRQLNQYKKSVIRIQFPDRTVLQGTFKTLETIKDVKEFVRGFLEDTKYNFHLYTTPPKSILKSEMSLIDADCVPSAIVHFGVDFPIENNQIFLKQALQNQFTSHSIASLAAVKSRGSERKLKTEESEEMEAFENDDGKYLMDVDENNEDESISNAGPSCEMKTERVKNSTEKVPKWFQPKK